MSNWQSFKKKHVLLMNAAFTVAIPAAVWLIMELLNLAFCGVHTLNSTVDYTTLMRNLVGPELQPSRWPYGYLHRLPDVPGLYHRR